jgi:hypothetical protein
MINGQSSIVVCLFGGAFGAASLKKLNARSATFDDKRQLTIGH